MSRRSHIGSAPDRRRHIWRASLRANRRYTSGSSRAGTPRPRSTPVDVSLRARAGRKRHTRSSEVTSSARVARRRAPELRCSDSTLGSASVQALERWRERNARKRVGAASRGRRARRVNGSGAGSRSPSFCRRKRTRTAAPVPLAPLRPRPSAQRTWDSLEPGVYRYRVSLRTFRGQFGWHRYWSLALQWYPDGQQHHRVPMS
jgi:hypothetical protein